jgi:hypothetical protein
VLSLSFENAPAEDYALIGPAPYFRLAGNRLQVGPGDLDIASYRQGRWHFPTGSFASITAQSPTQIAFEPGGSTSPMVCGPFDTVRFAQGAIWHGDGLRELVAEFDERSQSWSVYPDRVKCSGGVIAPVPGRPPGVTALADQMARESLPAAVREGLR